MEPMQLCSKHERILTKISDPKASDIDQGISELICESFRHKRERNLQKLARAHDNKLGKL